MTDHDLLRRYACENAQDAFAELVRRHVDLVYSAARRQVLSPQLAEEVAQSVFVDLARQAGRLRPSQPLGAWLHIVTRRTAVDVVRRESRRQDRERAAAEIAAADAPTSCWTQVEPLLDEALASLSETDHRAVLLRFFENRSLRDVGTALGLSDDAAQKRIGRALERLRRFLGRRGVTPASAAAFAADLSAHAVQAAPPALGGAIAANAQAMAGATQALAWPALSKLLASATTLLALGGAFYGTHALLRQRAETVDLQIRLEQLQSERQRLRASRFIEARQLKTAREELGGMFHPAADSDGALSAALQAWLARADQLKQLAAQRTDLAIPELECLTENTWLDVARDARLDGEGGIREAFAQLRDAAKSRLAAMLQIALVRYAETHRDELPAEPAQLAEFMPLHVSPTLFQRYEIVQRGKMADVPAGDWLLAEKPAIAQERDSRLFVNGSTCGTAPLDTVPGFELKRALRAYASAHPGQWPASASQLAPYFTPPLGPAALRTFLAQTPAEFSESQLRPLLSTR